MKNYELKVISANYPNYSFNVLLNGVIVLKGACLYEQEMLDCFEAVKLTGVQPMKTFNFPPRSVFTDLLLNCCDSSGYGTDLDNASDSDKKAFLKSTILSELGWMLEKQTSYDMALHWLQGLASACTIPFYNGQILDWLECHGVQIINGKEDQAVDKYWRQAAFAMAAIVDNKKA